VAKDVRIIIKKKRTWIILFSVLLAVALGLSLIYLSIPRVGYCYDAAFDETGERLYVTAGYRGLYVFSMTKEEKFKGIKTYYTSGYYRYLEIVGDRAYLANSEKGLEVLDIREDAPRPVWSQSGSKGYGIHIENSKVYLASNEYGLQIFDISNPDEPVLVGKLPTAGRVWDVWVNGATAFLADRDLGLIVVDVSTPSQPRQIGSLSWSEEPMAEVIDGSGDCVYVAAGIDGLIVVDVSDPTQPVITYQYDPGLDSYGEGVTAREGILYLTMDDSLSPDQNGLHIFDITKPAQPRLLSKYPLSDGLEDIAVAGARLAVANTYSGVVLFDVHALASPILVDMYPGQFWRYFIEMLR
jgi:hypothetical protein